MQIIRIALLVLVSIIPAYSLESPKIINFKNNVVFDHEGHKGDCISCHDTPEGGNKITGFGKEWAHKVCIGCHTSMGNGPISCSDCHKKQ